MMRLPKFEYLAPTSLQEATTLLAEHGDKAKLLAGGTDLLVSMKQKLFTPEYVIGLSKVKELQGIRFDAKNGLTLGANAEWWQVIEHADIRKYFPALIEAAEFVATPTLQNKGTVGGNLCLDTRCWYYNQSHFWRKSLGWCMKNGSDYCHVAPKMGKCVAVFSSDPVPAMIVYGASVRITGPKGERTILLQDLYEDDGISFLKLNANEIIVDVQIPTPPSSAKATHLKMRKRESIDYPIANTSVYLEVTADSKVQNARIVLGAVASAPLRASKAEAILNGQALTEEKILEASQAAFLDAKPLPNTSGTPLYRKKVVRVLVKRALLGMMG